MWESMALSINSVTFTSSSWATLETYNAEIWLTPRWEITFSTFQVDTPCRYDSMIAFTSAFLVREYRSKTFVSNGISRNCGFWRVLQTGSWGIWTGTHSDVLSVNSISRVSVHLPAEPLPHSSHRWGTMWWAVAFPSRYR
jgi:hypothetical protein